MRLVGQDVAFRQTHLTVMASSFDLGGCFTTLSTVDVQLLSSQRAKIGAVHDSNRTA